MTFGCSVIEDVLDRDDWDRFVSGHAEGHFFQSWSWGELQRGLGGRPIRLAALGAEGVAGCAQLLLFDSGDRRFVYVPRGPVVDSANDDVVTVLLDAMGTVTAREGAFLLRLEPQWADTPERLAMLAARSFKVARQHIMPMRTILVDLTADPDTIWARFHSNTRNRIRLAERRGVSIRTGTADDVHTFAQLSIETSERHGLRPPAAAQFELAWRLFCVAGTARLFIAAADGRDLAAIMVFTGSGTATYLWGASAADDASRKANPNQLLHWTAMQWARAEGCRTYDLFGIPDFDEAILEAEYGRQSSGWWNLYRFKRGFGGRVHRHLGTLDRSFAAAPPVPVG